ncbi:MAG TPA: hypothetical protein VFY71_00830 [Planctomycetota bacterium]|nr:hypothetical protein [Planctomycetota bacterium]
MSGVGGVIVFVVTAAAALLAVALAGYVLWKLLKGISWGIAGLGRGIGWCVRHVFELVAGLIGDSLRLAGHLLTACAYLPVIAINILLGRMSAANHYGSALESEVLGSVNCLYRLAIGHVARFLLLGPMVEGFERRMPDVIARAPGPDRPSGGANAFEGWKVTGSLAGGGSGGKLWLAEPTSEKRRELIAAGRACPEKVVIKSFSLEEGSTLPQIVRENRALAAARELGLVLEHELTSSRFHYVMPYVPGEDLGTATARLHARSGPMGLDDEPLRTAMGYAADLLVTLDRFHRAGLWHKDVKPSNILVADGRAQLVDLGLITPLASAMTLTTHGTEYFRDPEMVKLALKGVKVHEVDGVKFDVYGAGAVLYSLVENSFPVHGSLSQLSRRCPEALRWIVRRAMADMANRYASAQEMLADLRVVQGAPDPFRVRPAELPSLVGGQDVAAPQPAGTTPTAPATASPRTTDRFAARAPRRRLRRLSLGRGLSRGVLFSCALLLMLPLLGTWFTLGVKSLHPALVALRDQASSHKDQVVDAAPAKVDVVSPAPGGVQTYEPVSLDHLAPPAPAIQPRTPPLGVVLLLDDLPDTGDAMLGSWRTGLADGLQLARFALLGAGATQDDERLALTGFTAAQEIDLLAGARAAVGLSDPSDGEAARHLATWLGAQDQRLDAIVWIGRADPQQPVHKRVVARKAEMAERVTRAIE